MKKTYNFLIIFIISMVITVSCTIEIIEQPIAPIGTIDNESGAGTSIKDSVSLETLNTIPIDLGELGFTIDTRKLVVFGYKPVKVNVELFASLSSYSQQDIVVDEFTHTAIFKLAIEDLTEDTMETFANGVPIKITLFDKDNNLLETISNTKFVIKFIQIFLITYVYLEPHPHIF